jgi:hypothetical protein
MYLHEKKNELVFSSDKPFELFNENHVLEIANLNKCNNEEIKNLVPPNI